MQCMMLFSPLQLSLHNKAKEKALLQKANATKNLKNPWKAWEIPGRHGKSWESMGNPGKAWEIPARHRKSRQGIGNPGKAWKILGKHGRYQEFRESTGNPSPGSAVKTRKIPGFFSRWDLQWAYFSKSLKNNKKACKITGKHGKYRESIELPGKSRAGTASYCLN